MDIDKNVQKIIVLFLRKWKFIVVFGIIGALAAYIYTANFTTPTYASSIQFLLYAVDASQELSDSTSQAQSSQYNVTSNTSKMNYAMKMTTTYIELFGTNEFNQMVADGLNASLNTNYTASKIKSSISIENTEDTSLIKMTVTTSNAELSYQIARQLEKVVPQKLEETNNGLVLASVEDEPLKASEAQSLGYAKICAIGFVAGVVVAAAYVILRDLLDVRIKASDELSERFDIPVLGTIPEFELKPRQKTSRDSSNVKKEARTNG